MEKLDSKLEVIATLLTEVQVDIAEIRKDVAYHIKRTNDLQFIVERDLPKVQQHVDRVNFVISTGAYVGAILAISTLVKSITKWLG